MFFTLAISAETPALCAALTDRARVADPAVLPIPGPAAVVWRSPDGRASLLHWGGGYGAAAGAFPGAAADGLADGFCAADGASGVSHGGTIWAGSPTPGSGRAPVYARTSVTRVDPVYVTEVTGGVIVSDRATWAAWAASRLDDHDPLHVCALLNPGFALGSVTPFRGVSALSGSTTLHLLNGELTSMPTPAGPVSASPAGPGAGARGSLSRPSVTLRAPAESAAGREAPAASEPAGPVSVGLAGLGLAAGGPRGDADETAGAADASGGSRGSRPSGGSGGPLQAGARTVAEALVAAVAPLRGAGRPVELSLTGGKDSRLIAAALVAAGVPVAARTHGFADHPDVVTAAEIARRLGIEHIVRTPAAPGQQVDVLARIRGSVLVADGMLSAFENVGRPDPAMSQAVTAGGHGGELLRGGYAETAGHLTGASGPRGALDPARRAVRSAELLRRLTTKHLGLLRRGPALSYVASLGSWTPALARHPLQALDDFYLVNRAGRWSAAARQAYLLRERLAQPLFDDRVVLAARAVPLADRVSGALSAAVLAELSPAIADVPLAGKPPTPKGQPPAGAAMGAAHSSFDWRRQYGETIASFLRGYILDLGPSGGLFNVVSAGRGEAARTAAVRPDHRVGTRQPRLPAVRRLPPCPGSHPPAPRLLTRQPAPPAPAAAGRPREALLAVIRWVAFWAGRRRGPGFRAARLLAVIRQRRRRGAMITELRISTETFSPNRGESFRQDQSFRDHGRFRGVMVVTTRSHVRFAGFARP